MTRHARNSTAGAVYTYHEKQKDTRQSGYGSKSARLGKDSIKEFDSCCLTLQPCRYPVITPDGYLYDKEALIEYILHQKKQIAKQLKAYEKQKAKKRKEATDEDHADQIVKLEKFARQVMGKPEEKEGSPKAGSSKELSLSNIAEGRDKMLPSFWVPSLTPQAKKTEVKKPEDKVRCPMSGRPLKLKDLIEVHFREIKDGDKRSLITKDVRYVCAVTNDVLGNSVPCAVLKTSGEVVTMECVEKLIKKDMRDPINGKPLTDRDIVQFQRGSTGFSGTGLELKAKKDGPAMMA